MGITWINPPFNGGFFWLVPQQGKPVNRALASKERVWTAELSHRFTTLLIDLSSLELSLALTLPMGSDNNSVRKESDPYRPTP